MGTRIEGLSVVSGGFRRRHSALRLSVAAGRAALRQCGSAPRHVDLLVNTGLNPDRTLGEPALAPLIYEDLRANAKDPHPGAVGALSFDLANGACGVLTGMQVADGLLRAGSIRTALVVAGDADPGRGLAADFPFEPAGAAMVCRWAPDEAGLGNIRWRDGPDDGTSSLSTGPFEDGADLLTAGEDPVRAERAAGVAVSAALDALQGEGLCPEDVDVVVSGMGRPVFVKLFCAELDLPEELFVADDRGYHTVGLPAALRRAVREGRVHPGGVVLLVCAGAGSAAGAGVTAGAAVYRG